MAARGPVDEAGGDGAPVGRTRAGGTPHFLQRLAERIPRPPGEAEYATYLALLDECLADRRISRRESERLARVAAELGIDRERAAGLNRRYFEALVQVAREDGTPAKGALADLATVAALLHVPPAAFELAVAGAPADRDRTDA